MLETSARLLRLLSLFQSRRYWSGAELASRLNVTNRTLRRDIGKLRTLGYPIHSNPGVEGGYHLGAGSTMPPLLLEDDEAVAVALGLRGAATGLIEGIEETAVRALAKIEQLLPSRLRRRVASLNAVIVSSPDTVAAVNGQVLSAIAAACRDCNTLRFGYRDFEGALTKRHIEPQRLVHTGRAWYLVSWDLDRDDWRTFRLDRIQSAPVAGTRFTPRELPARDLAAYITRGIAAAPPCRARILIHASRDRMAARVPRWVGELEAIDDHTCLLETAVPCFESLAVHLPLLGVDFTILEPEELAQQVRILANRLRRATKSRPKSAQPRLAAQAILKSDKSHHKGETDDQILRSAHR
ncbi:MAG: helix-turn-helix transcriptional regulator [Bryobacteraceae bacterium]